MRAHDYLHLLRFFFFFFFFFPSMPSYSKSTIEPCSSSDACTSLLSYLLPWDSKLSEISSKFQLPASAIIASNSLDPSMAFEDPIFVENSLIKIPILCSCVEGIRRSVSTLYTVRVADSVDSIVMGFGGLVSEEQIRSFNGLNGDDKLVTGQRLVVPLPCSCFNNSNNGVSTVYMSYVVQRGESLRSIAMEYGSTVMNLEGINGLIMNEVVHAGDILAVPFSACSSKNLNWVNETMIVPNASYALTANNCVKCSCGPTDLNLRCSPSGLAIPCSHLLCKGTHLFIGDTFEFQTPAGCNVISCLYRGHAGGNIFRSLSNSSQIKCTGNQSLFATPPSGSPRLSQNTLTPRTPISPSPTPTAISNSSMAITESNASSLDSTSDNGRNLLRCPKLLALLLLEFLVLANMYHLLNS